MCLMMESCPRPHGGDTTDYLVCLLHDLFKHLKHPEFHTHLAPEVLDRHEAVDLYYFLRKKKWTEEAWCFRLVTSRGEGKTSPLKQELSGPLRLANSPSSKGVLCLLRFPRARASHAQIKVWERCSYLWRELEGGLASRRTHPVPLPFVC